MSIIKNTEELNNLLDAVQKLPVKKDEQEKTIDITENGTTVVTPDEGMTLGGVTINTAIESGGGTDYYKNIIQESLNVNGVDSTMGYISVFRNTSVKDVSMFDFSKIAWLSNAFQSTQIEELEIDATAAVYIDKMCMGCANLKKVVIKNMRPAVESVKYAFYSCQSLESVGTLNFGGTTNTVNCFIGCNSLRDVLFVPETIKVSTTIPSPVLSNESISGKQGIINGLNSEVTGQTLTIPRNAVKKAFETSEGANDGDESAEWLSLKDSKPNWTITLS